MLWSNHFPMQHGLTARGQPCRCHVRVQVSTEPLMPNSSSFKPLMPEGT